MRTNKRRRTWRSRRPWDDRKSSRRDPSSLFSACSVKAHDDNGGERKANNANLQSAQPLENGTIHLRFNRKWASGSWRRAHQASPESATLRSLSVSLHASEEFVYSLIVYSSTEGYQAAQGVG